MEMMRRSPDERLCPLSRFSQLSPEERLRIAADCLRRLRGLRAEPMTIPRVKAQHWSTNPTPLFEDGPGPGLEPVGGKFQPSFETGYLSGGAHLIFVLKDIIDLND